MQTPTQIPPTHAPATVLPTDAWLPLDTASASEIPLYGVAAIRQVEATAMASLPAFELMTRAGNTAAAWLAHHAPAGPLLLLAGPGNNGGDALVAATRLHQAGRQVQVWLTAEPDRLPADAGRAWLEARAAGVTLRALPETACHGTLPAIPGDTRALVDGLLGIGLNRAADGFMAQWIAHLADSELPVFALDIPSGLFADTGGGAPAVRACRTLTFIAAKPGLLTLDGRDCAGEVDIAPLGLPYPPAQPACATVNVPASFARALPARRHATNKGTFGSLAVIGGGIGMTGAPLLGARAALHLGAGRVHIGFLAQPAPLLDPVQPELMLHPIAEIALSAMSALVVGPGMGTGTAAREQFAQLLHGSACAAELPALVLDADALNLLASDAALAAMLEGSPLVRVMTPHPLEAARLAGLGVAEIQRDRLAAARLLATQWQAVIVLKGSGTVIAAPPDASGNVALSVNPTGNAGLATAGTGDVLAGMIGALLAQGMPALQAAQAAVWLHGRAADRLVAHGTGPAGLTASELYTPMRSLFNALLRDPRGS